MLFKTQTDFKENSGISFPLFVLAKKFTPSGHCISGTLAFDNIKIIKKNNKKVNRK